MSIKSIKCPNLKIKYGARAYFIPCRQSTVDSRQSPRPPSTVDTSVAIERWRGGRAGPLHRIAFRSIRVVVCCCCGVLAVLEKEIRRREA